MTVASDIASVRGLADNTTNLFRYLLLEMADRLGTNADWIAACMSVETGGTFSPSIRNPNGGATGLIQFMPATAKRLGTTTADLAAMSAEAQLEYVEAYFRPFTGRLRSPDDVYIAIFTPAHVGKPSENVISSEGEAIYDANKGLDKNGDGVITNGDVGATVRSNLAGAQSRPRIPVFPEAFPSLPSGGTMFGAVVVAVPLVMLWHLLRGKKRK